MLIPLFHFLNFSLLFSDISITINFVNYCISLNKLNSSCAQINENPHGQNSQADMLKYKVDGGCDPGT